MVPLTTLSVETFVQPCATSCARIGSSSWLFHSFLRVHPASVSGVITGSVASGGIRSLPTVSNGTLTYGSIDFSMTSPKNAVGASASSVNDADSTVENGPVTTSSTALGAASRCGGPQYAMFV